MTEEFRKRYNDYSCIRNECLENEIFHYTNSAEKLMSILKGKSFWATDLCDFWVDDELEGVLILQQINKFIETQDIAYQQIVDELIGNMDKQKEFITSDHNTFVVSMCKNGLSEYMWSKYATNDGYLISIDKNKFLNSLAVKLNSGKFRRDNTIFKRGDIVYDGEMQKDIMSKEFIELNELAECDNDIKDIIKHLMFVGNYYKNSSGSYENEEEYRILMNTETYAKEESFLPEYNYNEKNNKHYIEFFFDLGSINKIICRTKEAESRLKTEFEREGIDLKIELKEEV